jgi:hypothetical protein
MRNLFYISLCFSILGCVQTKDEIAISFFKGSDFIEIFEGDTIHLSFLDSTYSSLTKNGIQHGRNKWRFKSLENEQLLILGDFNPIVLHVINYSDTSCTLQGISQYEETSFTLYKRKKENLNVLGLWKSSKIPPPPDYAINNPDLWDSIFANDAFWESEIFEITEDSIKYSFYDNKTAIKYEKPFIQLENDLKAANGSLSVLRPIAQDDSTLTLEFYYTDGERSPDYENKKWVRKLKTVANIK